MPDKGHFVLYSYIKPPVTAGHYELVSEQTAPFPIAPEHTHVTVAAPRYVMPTEQIISTFPPANAEGAFGNRLPQIVLKRRTLPWERNPEGGVVVSKIPWLALVVVAEGEAQLSTATSVAQCFTEGTPLREPTEDKDVEQGLYLAVTETVVKKIFPCKDDLELLVHVREVDINDTELANGDDDGFLAVILANRLPVFDVANGKPVRYMACLVNLEGQLGVLPPLDPPEDEFTFALAQDWRVLAKIDPRLGPDRRVMGGIPVGDVVLPGAGGIMDARPRVDMMPRVATGQQGSPVAGVSLDGSATMTQVPAAQHWATATEKVAKAALDPDAKRLVRDTMALGFRFPIEAFALEKVYRFPVLAHWSFTTTEGETFETLMQKLDVGLIGMVPEPAADKPPALPGPEVMQTGHIGLNHRTRRGDPVRAWYRGPLVPFPTKRAAANRAPLLAHSADQLRRIIPDGREDLSLAAAFEIGRLLGLSQLSVVSALLRFRGEQFGAARVHEILSAMIPFKLPAFVGQRVDLGRLVALQVLGDMVKNPVDVLGPRRPVADPGRELLMKGDLDAVIAEGLGFDLEAVRKAGQQVGIVAALSQVQVPVANPEGQVRLDEQAIAGLRDALSTELEHVLRVAAPTTVVRPQGATRRARDIARHGAETRDALDELLARTAPEDSDQENE